MYSYSVYRYFREYRSSFKCPTSFTLAKYPTEVFHCVLYLQIATVLKRDSSACRVVVELNQSREILTLDYDDVCEYTGEIEDLY